MAARRRYGTYGRAITLPAAVLNSNVDWHHHDMPWHQRPAMTPCALGPSVLPWDSATRRIEARMRQRIISERLRAVHVPTFGDDDKSSIQELMNRYLNKSRELMSPATTLAPPSEPENTDPDEIRTLVNRYCSPVSTVNPHLDVCRPGYSGVKGSQAARKCSEENSEMAHSSDAGTAVRFANNNAENIAEPSRKSSAVHGTKRQATSSSIPHHSKALQLHRQIGSGLNCDERHIETSLSTGANRMPVASGSSRSGRLARISQSNIRPFGSAGAGGGYGPGGHPLSGPDPTCPTKKDVKHRFEITKKLGSGTYGKVSLAYDHKFDREVAVKLIKKSAIENKADLIRIRREIRIMSALHHPNIIQIFEVFENREKIILVMEYASGGELYDYVSHYGSLPESEARRIFRQITSAVLYCHKHQVAHRDLKLENILLDQDNNAKIADFGLSNYFGTKSLLTTFCGSPLYASPEIINGTPYKGPEVDCWSLGILLYTLVYGSMPFDGRDFNRMVRQIKRGAYYEPDTPSTASMLIRNMLRVNPERRADIFEIASHWWLNLEENMPVIQELPENQITDHTPLTERAETMIVQDLADETDVFMEFSHLSSETRKKIEEFRRRRKQAEEFNENSPIKPPKTARKDGEPTVEMKSEEKSLRGVQEHPKEKEVDDPLERLRQIENRLGQQRKKSIANNAPETVTNKEVSEPRKQSLKDDSTQSKIIRKDKVESKRESSPEQPEDPKPARTETPSRVENASRAPTFVPLSEPEPPVTPRKARQNSESLWPPMSSATYRVEVDSINMLMNQVLEQMEKGPVSLNLVARVKAHPLYDARPMVKELLESIIAAQPENVQKQTSKLIQQQSQEIARKSIQQPNSEMSNPPAVPVVRRPSRFSRSGLGERPWHSVEVGFDPDEELEVDSLGQQPTATAAIVKESDNQYDKEQPKAVTVTEPEIVPEIQAIAAEEEADTEDEEEYTDSEMEELADEVEQVEQKIVIEPADTLPPPDPVVVHPQYLEAFDRGLLKRQSKGKYQHSRVDMYGRGVSTECESPTLPRKPLGGPQPTNEQSPFLFDKAKKIIMQYPGRPDLSEIEDAVVKRKKDWLKTQDPDQQAGGDISVTPTPSVGSAPARTPPPTMDQEEAVSQDSEDEDEECSDEDSSEQSETEIERRHPRGPVIGEVRRDGDKIETKTVDPIGRKLSFMQSAPASIHSSQSPELKTSAKDYVANSEFIAGPPAEPKCYTMISEAGLCGDQAIISKSNDRPSTEPQQNPIIDEPRTRGKESWETTSAYIRRKGRERRLRNRTVGGLEDLQRDVDRIHERSVYDDLPLSHAYQGRHSPIGTDPFYSRHTGPLDNLSVSYTRPRHLDENYKRHDNGTPSIGRFGNAEYRDDRAYDHSAVQTHTRNPCSGMVDGHNYYPSNASPSFPRKLDENQSWACEPRRFEVYKTRAERDAERNCYAPAGAPSYRPTSYYSTNDRPMSNFAHRKVDDPYKADAYRGAGDFHRNRYDDNYGGYKRAGHEFEMGASSGAGQQPPMISIAQDPTPPILNRIRQTARRIPSNESDRYSYTRARSMDRKTSMPDELGYGGEMRVRPISPEPVGDYTYVNYHDSSNGRANAIKDEKRLPRSILKNKQSIDVEQRNEGVDNFTRRSEDTTIGPVRSVIDRLRRHLSLEKSSSPQAQMASQQTALGAGSTSLTPNAKDAHDRGFDNTSKKKRSLLSFNRRRTSEVRMDSDGKLLTNGCDDGANYKRPSSPMEKIKSLFRKHDVPHVSSTHSTNDYYPGRYTGNSATDKLYGANASLNVPTSRDVYVPQYRKYPGSSSRDPSSVLNRYSYTSGISDQRRHWYDDHNMY